MRRTPQIKWGAKDGERISFLREHYPLMTLHDLTLAFNRQFSTTVTEASIGYQLNVHRILKSAPARKSQRVAMPAP